mmetsp:Transcript_9696/g.20141  ORF Transcript_9696/g.20141 Transcript_9696/m.20141 type:complete len:242 (-) Transcript_9696:60-785(-)
MDVAMATVSPFLMFRFLLLLPRRDVSSVNVTVAIIVCRIRTMASGAVECSFASMNLETIPSHEMTQRVQKVFGPLGSDDLQIGEFFSLSISLSILLFPTIIIVISVITTIIAIGQGKILSLARIVAPATQCPIRLLRHSSLKIPRRTLRHIRRRQNHPRQSSQGVVSDVREAYAVDGAHSDRRRCICICICMCICRCRGRAGRGPRFEKGALTSLSAIDEGFGSIGGDEEEGRVGIERARG